MDTGKLKKFAQAARRDLIQQVAGRLEQVLAEGSLARREQTRTVADLEKQIQALGRNEVIERAAYTWFNRFTALRFMDAKGYNQIMAVSPAEGQSQPAILADAKQGHIDERVVPEKVRERVFTLLDGRTPSRDAQGEAYRLLLVAVCNYWQQAMPFLFERIADWTELLMPDDLLSDGSVRTRIRTVLAADDCQDVEVIGWLYQFYISEKKDEVFAGLKKKQKITSENIPAATQLFTPHWIVRYLVENSLGRLWLLNRPQSKLAKRMDYYIAPEEPETDYLRIEKPEDIRICDPACGSAHMLTYAFDLLHAIYQEEGYDLAEIPSLILENNLYGIEIDHRAGALAAFALMMKAAERLGRRRFLRLDIQPNICVLQNVSFSEDELNDYVAEVGKDLFTAELRKTLGQFEQANNFGSLIQPALQDPAEVRRVLATKEFEETLFLNETHQQVLRVLQMAEFLSPKYHAVIANPPYMGSQGMNDPIAKLAKKNFPEAKADLYAIFVVRGINLSLPGGLLSMITMQSWMFLSAFETLRLRLLRNNSILTFLQIGYNSFPELNSKIALACAFVIKKGSHYDQGAFINLNDAPQTADKNKIFFKRKEVAAIHWRRSHDFSGVPGSPIAYWLSEAFLDCFSNNENVGSHARASKGLVTANNEEFVRIWSEVSLEKLGFGFDRRQAKRSGKRWFPYAKGGEFRRWYGNFDSCVNWEDDGCRIQSDLTADGKRVRATNFNLDRIFKPGISWTVVTTSDPTFRIVPSGFLFDAAAGILQTDNGDCTIILGALNSKAVKAALAAINPTLNLHPGYLESIPYAEPAEIESAKARISRAIEISKEDWDTYEISWDFTMPPILSSDHRAGTLETTYTHLRCHWHEMTEEMRRLEESNNRVFISSYGLQEELSPKVPLNEITLTCNPTYRYGGKLSDEEREQRLLADTITEFLLYAVGCMFGRYSLDVPGLILANQGETLDDYLARIPKPTFAPDDDNVIPILDDTWFTDDIVERFQDFLRLTFGDEHFQENLTFVESALGKPLRKYFVKDFYKDHVKRYKKRPIYWLFSSPKGSFNALIYMHRYRSDTVSVILNDYLREFRTKLAARVRQLEEIEASASSSASDKTAALKEIIKLRATIAELEDWERKVLLPLASEKVEIDLDDGVKANYPKFGSALAKVPGLSA